MNKLVKTIFAMQKSRYNLQENSAISPVFSPSLNLVDGDGDYVFDQKGMKYIDFTSGIAVNAFGHRNSKIINAVESQLFKLMHVSNLYTTPIQLELTSRLVSLANKAFSNMEYLSVFLSNSGTEANEAALKFGRAYVKRTTHNPSSKLEIISFSESFHGRSMGALSVTGQEKYKAPFAPLIPNVTILPYNDVNALQAKANSKTAIIIVEPMQGEGGLTPMTTTFANAINEIANKHNIIVIADEIQAGLYRTGTLFASTKVALTPHIITLAKSLGGGLPLGATITCKKVHDILIPGDHGSTMGGNPIAASAAISVLKTLKSPSFFLQRTITESSLNSAIEQFIKKNPDTSALGAGCLRGIRLPSLVQSANVVEQARTHGLLILRTGKNSIRIAPSLICSPSIIKAGMHILYKSYVKAKGIENNHIDEEDE